ncbi:MAG: hypothetical protein BWX92_03220 [Deltaproteobacteria bacterium ADurb.Bin135]|nr:MAG: hypothetical protein BWX92_03220 [Deltaproteobacteria bacterium ADurb.Bin135]
MEKSREVQMQHVVKMVKEIVVKDKGSKQTLNRILAEILKNTETNRYMAADRYMESKLLKDIGLPPKALAEMYIYYNDMPAIMKRPLTEVAKKVKNRLIQQGRRALIRNNLKPVPCSEMVFNAKTRRPCSPPKEEIPTYTTIAPTKTKTVKQAADKTNPDSNNSKYIEPSRTYENFIDLIDPYIPHISKMGFSEILETALFRVTQYGNHPSLLPRTALDMEAAELSGYRDLQKVYRNTALADHIYLVLKHAIALVNKISPKNAEAYAPWLIPMCLTMDLAIAESFRTKADLTGNMTDHTVLSADLFSDLMKSATNPPPETKIKPLTEAIKNHHVPAKHDEDIFSKVLRQANVLARQEEVIAANTNLVTVDFEKWFAPSIVIETIKKDLNQSPKLGLFTAIHFKDLIWTHPDAIYLSVRKYAETEGIFDMRLYLSSERPEMMSAIFDAIRKAGYLADTVQDNSIGHHYFINFLSFKGNGRKKIPSMLRFLTPLKTNAFNMTATQLDKGKSGWTKMIHSINRTKKYAATNAH